MVPPSHIKDSVAGIGAWSGLLVAAIVQICATPVAIGGAHNGNAVYAMVVHVVDIGQNFSKLL